MMPTGTAYGLPFPPPRKRRDTGCCPKCGKYGERSYKLGEVIWHKCNNLTCYNYGQTLPLLAESDGQFVRRLYSINYPIPKLRFIETEPGQRLCPLCAHPAIAGLDDDDAVTVHTFPIDKIPECTGCGWTYLLTTVLKENQ